MKWWVYLLIYISYHYGIWNQYIKRSHSPLCINKLQAMFTDVFMLLLQTHYSWKWSLLLATAVWSKLLLPVDNLDTFAHRHHQNLNEWYDRSITNIFAMGVNFSYSLANAKCMFSKMQNWVILYFSTALV